LEYSLFINILFLLHIQFIERRCTGYGILVVGWTKIQPREGSL
jgi:hypothetical protein